MQSRLVHHPPPTPAKKVKEGAQWRMKGEQRKGLVRGKMGENILDHER